MEHTIVSDNDGHDYIIPYDKVDEWYQFTDIPSDDKRSWNVPEWAHPVGGSLSLVAFKEWRFVR